MAREKVVGVGGIFIRAKNAEALRKWYFRHLGVVGTAESVTSWLANLPDFASSPLCLIVVSSTSQRAANQFHNLSAPIAYTPSTHRALVSRWETAYALRAVWDVRSARRNDLGRPSSRKRTSRVCHASRPVIQGAVCEYSRTLDRDPCGHRRRRPTCGCPVHR